MLPYGEALISVPSTLVALCLNAAGLQRVLASQALSVFTTMFTSRKYAKALGGDTPPIIGAGLEELMRMVPQTKAAGMDVVVHIFKAICILGGEWA